MDRRTWKLFLTAILALVLLGCRTSTEPAPTPEPGPPQHGGKVVFGLHAESDGFSPTTGRWAPSTYIVGFSIMDPLLAYDKDQKPQPYLARSISSNADFTEWTIGLRSGVRLHNGQPVDAALVKRNLELQKASTLTGEALAFMDSVSVGDPLTVRVKMSKPWSTFAHILTSQVGTIASETTLTSAEGSRKPIGSGPFVLDDWTPNKSVKAHKNNDYWRHGYPYLDAIEFHPVGDINSRTQQLDTGSLNLFETNDPDQILHYTERSRTDPGLAQIFTNNEGARLKIFVALNVTKQPFDDPIARQAVAYAGDVNQVSEQAYMGVFPPASGPFDRSSPFHSETASYPRHDLQKAKQLARDYERRHGKPLEFTTNVVTSPEVAQVAQVLQAQEAEAGIKVNIQSLDQPKLILDALLGNYQATGFILFGSPHIDREYVFIASQAKPNGEFSLNFTRMGLNPDGSLNDDNRTVVDAMDKARTTNDPVEQKRQYDLVQEAMARNLNFLFLVSEATAIVSDGTTEGVRHYTLPNEDGGDGLDGMETTQTFTFNLWIRSN